MFDLNFIGGGVCYGGTLSRDAPPLPSPSSILTTPPNYLLLSTISNIINTVISSHTPYATPLPDIKISHTLIFTDFSLTMV